jgi:hypothetical protein
VPKQVAVLKAAASLPAAAAAIVVTLAVRGKTTAMLFLA